MAEHPIRIQRKRTKGWKMPPNTVYVGRPGNWGNPFPCAGRHDLATERYRQWLFDWESGPKQPYPPTLDGIRQALRGKNLCCWCGLDDPCHADILLEIANG